MKKKTDKDQSQGMDRRTFLKMTSALSLGVAALGAPKIASAQKKDSGEKIDIFPHILPKKYNEVLLKKSRPSYNLEANRLRPALVDLDLRFKTMDKFEAERLIADAPNLARLPNIEKLRIVTIEGQIPIPCGGTHVLNLKEIGSLEVQRIAPAETGFRLHFEVR